MADMNGKTVLITGASRGIGLAIAKRCAKDGAAIAILAKTAEPNPKLPGTIFTAAEEIEAAGGRALPIACDIRDEAQVQAAVAKTVEAFGGIDACVNNASAIFPRSTLETPIKRWDLMHQVNARGTFLVTQTCLPHLLKSERGHMLALSPPLDMKPRWFGPHVAYSSAKFGMSLCVLGMADEFQGKVAVNALWPRTAIATAAVSNVLADDEALKMCRTPEILADAAHEILTRPMSFTGNFLIDDSFLFTCGVVDFDQYRVDPSKPLMPDFFVPDEIPAPPGVEVLGPWATGGS